jgi:hypothetical protein
MIIASIMVVSPWDEIEISDNSDYSITKIIMPFVNIIVWTFISHLYFKKKIKMPTNQPRRKQQGMVVLNKELQPEFNTFLTAQGSPAQAGSWVLNPSAGIKNALALGVFWLILAVIIDLIFFVLIKNPLSVDTKGFYIDQFPWIYITYAAILLAPIFYNIISKKILYKLEKNDNNRHV